MMIHRTLQPRHNRSFFLFGARGTGKSTLLNQQKFLKKKCLWIDLLEPEQEEKYSLRPQTLLEELESKKERLDWVVIDEIQKSPKLLDVIHKLIETTDIQFALTGSSSRKLRRLGSNLLAGRAFKYFLYPLTSKELDDHFHLEDYLNWGGLPEIFNLADKEDKILYLKSYYEIYLKEEIVAEQAVRNLNPFRLFLPLCMQNETEPLNFTNISESAGVDVKTIQNYYQILIDTHLGFYLNADGGSIRAVQKSAPKFYFFDPGVRRAIEKQLTIPVKTQTPTFGKLFESWFINECHRYNEYYQLDYEFSYLRTKDDAEIDLIVRKPDKSVILIEIKSTNKVEDRHLKHLKHFQKDFPQAQYICVSQEKQSRKVGSILILPWKEAFKKIGFN